MTPTTLSPDKAKRIAQNPYFFAANFLKIQDKDDRIVPLIYNPLQLDYLKNRTPRDLILKPRQIGFSTAIQAEICRYSTTRPTRSFTLTDDTQNTTKMRLMQQKFYDYMPEDFKPERSISNATLTIYPEFNSEMLSGTAGNTDVGRAGSYRIQHYSEIGFYKDASMIMKSALQGGRPFWVVAESTPNGARGWFYEKCMEALRNPQSVWKLHFYTWFDFPEYRIPLDEGETLDYDGDELELIHKHNVTDAQLKWRRYKISETDKRTFIQEYPNDPISCFLTSGGGVFNLQPENIATGITQIEYNKDSIYVSGQDNGQDNDYTSLSIFELRTGLPAREVFLGRWRRESWGAMRAHVLEQLAYYHVEKHVVERNSMGSYQIEDLIIDADNMGISTSFQAFRTSNPSKDNIVKMLQKALTEGGVQLLDIDYANHEMRTYETKQTTTGLWTYTHPDGGHDDCVDARLLANYAATQLWI